MGNCIGTIMSNVTYFSEKFAMFLSFTCLITCAILCMISMLAFGIGLGYNYSYVDTKTKHVYVAASIRKTRPSSYYGPGFFKPTKKSARRRYWQRVQTENETQLPKVVEYISESPDDLLSNDPPNEMIGVGAPARPHNPLTEKNLLDLYFTIPKKEQRFSVPVFRRNESTTDMSIHGNTNHSTYKVNTDQANIALNDSDVSILSNLEPIIVNVTKTNEKSPPFVLRTKMLQSQLAKWLSRLQRANKTFAVHVTTN